MNLETKIIIYKFTPQVFTLTLFFFKNEPQHYERFSFSRYICAGYYGGARMLSKSKKGA